MNAPEDKQEPLLPPRRPVSAAADGHQATAKDRLGEQEEEEGSSTVQKTTSQAAPPKYQDELVKIKRTYKFAGEVITEEKFVPKDSAEARLFLAATGKDDAEIVKADDIEAEKMTTLKLCRPLRRISRFDPNPGLINIHNNRNQQQPVLMENASRGPKINTVEKSRLDWAAYVDQAGIKDELRTHSKAKEDYHHRMDFLNRVDAKKEEERRNVRLSGL